MEWIHEIMHTYSMHLIITETSVYLIYQRLVSTYTYNMREPTCIYMTLYIYKHIHISMYSYGLISEIMKIINIISKHQSLPKPHNWSTLHAENGFSIDTHNVDISWRICIHSSIHLKRIYEHEPLYSGLQMYVKKSIIQ